ncbi:MAG: hypothetical protein WA975_18250 [Mesorhizobium sp.]
MDLLSRVFAEIDNHRGRASPSDALVRFADPLRHALKAGSVRLSAQEWPIDKLRSLWSKNETGRPQYDEGPIIVLRIGGIDMLIDGHNRRRKRLRDRDRATQSVLLVELP